MVVFWCSDTQV